MDDVQIGRISVEREVVAAAALVLAAGAAGGVAAVLRVTTGVTPWRLARCAFGGVLVAIAAAVAAWVGAVVLYVAGAWLPDPMVGLAPVLGLASAGGVLFAVVPPLVRLLAGRRPGIH